MSSWTVPMDKFVGLAEKQLDQACRKMGISFFRGVELDTPVDTGNARGSWQATVGHPATSAIERLDKSGQQVVAEIIAKATEWKPLTGQVFYMVSLCPYMVELNGGHSKQAPKRFIEINAMRVAQSGGEA